MPATPQDRLYGLTTSVAVKPPVYISADYDITRFGEQTITSKTPTDERTITTTEGMRVLLLGQDNPVENGIWVARRSFWVRATDFNGPRDAVNGTLVFSINGDCWQVEADDPVVIGKSVIHFRPTYPFEANLDIFQRTLRVPEASVNVLPSAEERAWKGLGFDGAGQPKLQDPAGTGLWGYVPAIGSFEKGSLLTQRFEVLLWESTDEYWRWDGAMPKIVLPGSTPDTAGGRGKGKWLDVTDATLRSNLGSSEGAKLVGGIGFVSPEMFGYLHGVTPDAVPYFQAAVDEGHARGLPVQLTGKYYATTYPHKVTLPGDDGTAYPGWVAAGNDANIAAESGNHIYAAIRLYPDSVIIGDSMQNCALIGDWDSDTPVINNNQHIGYFISGDSSDGYIRPQLVNHGVRNFFIGRYGNGVLDRSTEDNFLIRDCCLTGWFMGADSVCNGFVVARDCFTGDAYGGAWTQRNAAVTIPYLPPYPAAEIFKVGWVDAIRYTKYHFYGKPRLFGPADEAIDTWFDTYIYKSANSARTSAGGRLTNNTASGYSARSFPGIAGRAFTVLSRYGRAVNGVCLDDVKVLGTHRVPVLQPTQAVTT
ncbi:endo-N-acetylneuraminidase [Klebsiella michiganensis]|nr:endo-N-acetylneuraminidase [Klebsiella michiganensis]